MTQGISNGCVGCGYFMLFQISLSFWMDPVLKEFFLFLCCRGLISSFHRKMRSYFSSLKQVGVLGHLIGNMFSLLWLHLFQSCWAFMSPSRSILFSWLALFWACLSPKSSLFFRELYRRNAFGLSKNNGTGNPRIGCWHLRRLGDIVPKLDYTNGASNRTEQQTSPFVRSGGRKRMLLSSCNDVAGERKRKEERMPGLQPQAKEMAIACASTCSSGWCLAFVTRSFRWLGACVRSQMGIFVSVIVKNGSFKQWPHSPYFVVGGGVWGLGPKNSHAWRRCMEVL